MKILLTLAAAFFVLNSSAQQKDSLSSKPDPSKKVMTVDAGCGECKLGLEGKGCTLAVRVEGKSYFVDGTKIDNHGDAHAADGFCNAVRQAEVQGEIVDNRFKATYFRLLPQKSKPAN